MLVRRDEGYSRKALRQGRCGDKMVQVSDARWHLRRKAKILKILDVERSSGIKPTSASCRVVWSRLSMPAFIISGSRRHLCQTTSACYKTMLQLVYRESMSIAKGEARRIGCKGGKRDETETRS